MKEIRQSFSITGYNFRLWRGESPDSGDLPAGLHSVLPAFGQGRDLRRGA